MCFNRNVYMILLGYTGQVEFLWWMIQGPWRILGIGPLERSISVNGSIET